jgi:hypothetical protein
MDEGEYVPLLSQRRFKGYNLPRPLPRRGGPADQVVIDKITNRKPG